MEIALIVLAGIVGCYFILMGIIAPILVWYIRRLLQKLALAEQVSTEFFARIIPLQQHIQELLRQDLFYNDPILKNLFLHVKSVNELLEQSEEIYSFIQPDLPELIEDLFKEEEPNDGTEEDSEKEEK